MICAVNIMGLVINVYNSVVNNGSAEQLAGKIPENLAIESCGQVQGGSSTPSESLGPKIRT